jgi:hypothetical protein
MLKSNKSQKKRKNLVLKSEFSLIKQLIEIEILWNNQILKKKAVKSMNLIINLSR